MACSAAALPSSTNQVSTAETVIEVPLTTGVPSENPPVRQRSVRNRDQNWFYETLYNKTLLYLFTFVTLLVVTITSWDLPCETPLHIYLLLLFLAKFPCRWLCRHCCSQQSFVIVACLQLGVLILGQHWFIHSGTCNALPWTMTLVTLVVYFYPPILFLTCVLVFYLCECWHSHRSRNMLASLKHYVLSHEQLQSFVSKPACSICQTDFALGDDIRILPCAHEFHVACVDQWLLREPACPNCRRPIASGPVIQ